MQAEHYLMAIVALLATYLVRRDPVGVYSVLWSQMPFWAGSAYFFAYGGQPFFVNLGSDLVCAAGFLLAAHIYDRKSLIALCTIFTAATVVDIYALVFGLQLYVEIHEVLHYASFIVIVGRQRIGGLAHSVVSYMRRRLARH